MVSGHIPPCDVEENGGDCSCAETWRAQLERLSAVAQSVVNKFGGDYQGRLNPLHEELETTRALLTKGAAR